MGLKDFFRRSAGSRGVADSAAGPAALPPSQREGERADATRRCSLVITNYNGLANLKAYLPLNLMAVAEGGICDDVIVVDDGSTDGSVEYLWRAHPLVRVVPMMENRGFGAAANAGFRAARNEFVANISNDMVITGQFFALLFENMVAEDIFMAGARLVGPDGLLQRGRTQPFFLGDFRTWKAFSDEPDETWGPKRRLYHHAWSAIGLYRRRIFLELGGFDPLFLPVYAEENDLCYRAWRRGYRVLYEPRAWVVHYHVVSGTIERTYGWEARKVQYRRNRLIFFWKNVTHPVLLALHAIWVLSMAAVSWASPQQIFYKGFRSALAVRARILERRREEARYRVRTDLEVLARIRQSPELASGAPPALEGAMAPGAPALPPAATPGPDDAGERRA